MYETEQVFVVKCADCEFKGEAQSAGMSEITANDHINAYDEKQEICPNMMHTLEITQLTRVRWQR